MMRKLIALSITFAFVVGNLFPVPLFARTSETHSRLSAPSKVNGPSDPEDIQVKMLAMSLLKAVGKKTMTADQLWETVQRIVDRPGVNVFDVFQTPVADGAPIIKIVIQSDMGKYRVVTLNLNERAPKGRVKIEELSDNALEVQVGLAEKGGDKTRLALLERKQEPIMEQAVAPAEAVSALAKLDTAATDLETEATAVARVRPTNSSDVVMSGGRGGSAITSDTPTPAAEANISSSTSEVVIDNSDLLGRGKFLEPPPPPIKDATAIPDGNDFTAIPAFGGPPPDEYGEKGGASQPNTSASILRFLPPNVRDSKDGLVLLAYAHLDEYLKAAGTLQDWMQQNVEHDANPTDGRIASLEAWMHAPMNENGTLSNAQVVLSRLKGLDPGNSEWPTLENLIQSISDDVIAQVQSSYDPQRDVAIAEKLREAASINDGLLRQTNEPLLFVTNSPLRSNEEDYFQKFIQANQLYEMQHNDPESAKRDRAKGVVNHALSRETSQKIANYMKDAFFATQIPALGEFVDSKLPAVPIVLMVGMAGVNRAALIKDPQRGGAITDAIWISRELYDDLWRQKPKLMDRNLMGDAVLTDAQANEIILKTVMILVGEELTGVHIGDTKDPIEGELFEDATRYILLTSLSQDELLAHRKLYEWIGQGDANILHVGDARGQVAFIDSYLVTLQRMLPGIVSLSDAGIQHFINDPWNLAQHNDELIFIPWLAENKAIGEIDPATGKTYFNLMRERGYRILQPAKIGLINNGFKEKFGKTFSELFSQVLAARNIEARLAMQGFTPQLGLADLETKGVEILALRSAILKMLKNLPKDSELYKSFLKKGKQNVAIEITLLSSWSDVQELMLAIDTLKNMKPDGIVFHVLFGSAMSRDQAIEFLKRVNLFAKISIIARDTDALVNEIMKDIKFPEAGYTDEQKREHAKSMTTLILDADNWSAQVAVEALGALTGGQRPSVPQMLGQQNLADLTGEYQELFKVVAIDKAVESARAVVFGALLGSTGPLDDLSAEDFIHLVETYIEGPPFGVTQGRAFKPELREDGVVVLRALDEGTPERKMLAVMDRTINMAREITNSM